MSKKIYKLLNVIYVLVFIVSSIYVILNNINEYAPKTIINFDKTSIKCNDGTTYRVADFDSDERLIIMNFQHADLVALCSAGTDSIILWYDRDKYKDSPKNYEIRHAYETKGSWAQVIGRSAFLILLIAIFLVIIRQLVYYIDLGKMLPEKKKKKVHSSFWKG